MEPLMVKSAQDSSKLRLGPPENRTKEGYYRAELRGPGVNAVVRAYDNQIPSISSYFQDLADHCNGWQGEKKRWDSLEGHVLLSATSDTLGHIYLRVVLQLLESPFDWRAEGTVLVESGQLSALAKSARQVFGGQLVT